MNKSKAAASPDEFWSSVERIYGEVPSLIKLILQINGFNSFLALKGIRYEDKQEFFQSLELTVHEILSSDIDSQEKLEVEAELVTNHQSIHNFKLKPGHRNYIMNLMLEIENIDVNDFFGRSHNEPEFEIEQPKPLSPVKHEYTVAHLSPPNTSGRIFVRSSKSDKKLEVKRVDHGYSQHDQEQQEQDQEPDYIFEEEYLTDDTMDSIIRVEYDPIQQSSSKKRKSNSIISPSLAKRRPEQMYNEEFIAKCVNPRRRRVTLNKTYATDDEGTRERFTDLINQSMECILPREKLAEIEGCELHVEKETDSSWAVYCPLCHSRIRLPVVHENGGRYCNYKRSNFERHLRFKHCKGSNQREIYDAVETIEEIIE